jgi:hypothetical protein
MPSQVDLSPTVRPSVSLSPSEVVSAQFKALSRGRVGQDRDGVAGIDAALGFVAPNIVEQRGTELNQHSWLGRRPAANCLPGGFLSAADHATGCPVLPASPSAYQQRLRLWCSNLCLAARRHDPRA